MFGTRTWKGARLQPQVRRAVKSLSIEGKQFGGSGHFGADVLTGVYRKLRISFYEKERELERKRGIGRERDRERNLAQDDSGRNVLSGNDGFGAGCSLS